MGQSPSTAVPLPELVPRKYSDSNRFSNLFDDPNEHFDFDFSDDSTESRDFMADLPDDCLARIFNCLSSGDRKRCSLVCRRWHRVDGQTRHRLSLNAKSGLLDFVPFLFNRFDSVTKLALRCDRKSTSINDDALILISLRCKNLTRLKLRGCREITETGMAGIGDNCKVLKKLSFSSCMFGAKGINAVIGRFRVLEELSVKRLRGAHDSADFVDFSGAGTSSLKSITLKELVNGQSFAPLVIGSKKLRTLKVISCLGDWDETLKAIGCSNNGLVEIHLEKIQVSDVGLGGVSNCLGLETLHIVKTAECSNYGICGVAERCKLLRKIHIDGWRTNRIGDDALISIAKHCLNLQELVLIGIYPTYLSLAAIASNCKSLERLALCGIVTVGDAEIECIAAKCGALRKLCIKGCPISNAGIGALASGCPSLVKIKIKKCKKITGKGVEWLREKRASLMFSYDDSEVEALDGSGSDGVGAVQDNAIADLPALEQINMIDAASSSINHRLTMFRTRIGFVAGFRRWANSG
ncbi:hypothetical protein Lal_00027650 [Lupinus albus]|uniref:Putative F-box domain, leucine-rich repeat domain, L domain-containing protein n=1 Tax=Lupinus albus TaxID=3870 RepID=A0A6A5MSB3_LUPAL|nr:putative F-box domain, leucine-rich repeat domain, L domain-containing protein [Lupinus albus]KAF1873612.1 hypothetical protein Lal_00027650 [Lupinus albus]